MQKQTMDLVLERIFGNLTDEQTLETTRYALSMLTQADALKIVLEWIESEELAGEVVASLGYDDEEKAG